MSGIADKIKKLVLVFGDIVLLYFALWLILLIRYSGDLSAHIWQIHFWPFTIMFIIWITAFYIMGLYDSRQTKNDINFYTLVFRSLLVTAGIGVVYFYAFSARLFSIRPQLVFLLYLVIFGIIFLLWRRLYNQLTQTQIFQKNVLFIGDGTEMDQLIKDLRNKPYLGYRVVDHIALGDASSQANLENLDISKLLVDKRVDTVVTTLELHKAPGIVSQFYKNLFLGISYFDFPTFYEMLTSKVPVTTIGQLWFLENLFEKEKNLYEMLKRVTDFIFAVILLPLGVLLTPLIALIVKLDSKGPVLFKQVRIGHKGKTFEAIKFRSMQVGAEKNGAQWASPSDPRVTRIGRFLRKSRLDEIPQLINVLRNEMSFIGPRPERPEFVDQLKKQIPFYDERHLIKPGLTGWAQVNFKYGASAEDAMEKLQYDLFYIKNRSVFLDIGIVLKTVNIILSGKGQ
ncbi:MAG: hypothetical protein A2826_02475 [Candidatus Doudnabacteria bacterium RIFCSPHIGHO2_01_FULL_43_23]|uniref:Bacterial sugar transferase domain-containing protein n=1 Tax=Candidatus Doudnabacteria bacterium RIFCSPHIGHO2_01_FULL_43_23 TaxID=1817822 RepID=A0A1F5NTI2_9BACT|nr:MAG: hypothetical protein A2826_02475 [Candidatus Doudnabacteria bacterium RIFCSPHIGHO2_01_FULL_43_23]